MTDHRDHRHLDAEVDDRRQSGDGDADLPDVTTAADSPHGRAHDGTAIGNCTSNECAIRGVCSYTTACRKIRADDRLLKQFVRAYRDGLLCPATVGEAAAMASELLDRRAADRKATP